MMGLKKRCSFPNLGQIVDDCTVSVDMAETGKDKTVVAIDLDLIEQTKISLGSPFYRHLYFRDKFAEAGLDFNEYQEVRFYKNPVTMTITYQFWRK